MTRTRRSYSRNPFGLSDRECEIMESFIEHGCVKGVMDEYGIAHKTVQNEIRNACKRMGVETRVLGAIRYDRSSRRASDPTPFPASSVFTLGAEAGRKWLEEA